MWAFWIACALLVIAGVAPFAFGAGTRLGAVLIPFGVGAAAMALNALLHHQGRPLAATLYFIAGIATTYGILAMLAVPLRLAVVGTCPPTPGHCSGLEQNLSLNETNALSIAVALGVIAILVGFFGLLVTYRRGPAAQRSAASRSWPDRPPETPAAPTTVEEPTADVKAEVKPEPEPEPEPEAEPEPAPMPEPPPPPPETEAEPLAEREAPAEMLELPAPAEEPAPPPPSEPAPPPKPARRPRTRRAPKPKPPGDEAPPADPTP
jgi:hypothetical protein